MLQSFYNSVSGIKAQQFGMDITSNNISNVNNHGFKGTTAEFKTIFEKAAADGFAGPTNDQVGLGAVAAASALDVSQGSFENTDREFDLAIGGDGWFNVAPMDGAENENYYTRNGNFSVNAQGYLVGNTGMYLMGVNANNITEDNFIDTEVEMDPLSEDMAPISIPTHIKYPALPTTDVSLQKNLTYGTTYQKQTIGIVTPEGTKSNLVIEFTPSATQPAVGTSWDYNTYIQGDEANALSDTLLFDSNGGLIDDTVLEIDNGGTPITFDLGGGFDGIISTTGKVNTSVIANGKPEGDLTSYRVDNFGNIVASFDNSESATIGKIPLYHFMNDQGLDKAADNLFQASSNSGEAKTFLDENGEFTMGSQIKSNMLEMSNVNLSDSLTNLIVYQKAFDASARGITTSDEMIQTAINLKR